MRIDRLALTVLLSLCALSLTGASAQDGPEDRAEEQAGILKEYLAQARKAGAVVAKVRRQFRKPFEKFTEKDYARFMDGLDLAGDEDLWKWSHVTGIPLVVLQKGPMIFCFNTHLLRDIQGAAEMASREFMAIKSSVDKKSGKLTLKSGDGGNLPTRDLPADLLQATERTGPIWHNKDFAEDRTVVAVLEPWIVSITDIPNRKDFSAGIRALPLSVVKIYHGKAIYVSLPPGRGYAIAMPVSNTTYKPYAGLQAGFFLERRDNGRTAHTFIHEIGHVIDYTVIQGGYGANHRFPFQFPEFRTLLPLKRETFGKKSDPVPKTDYGYVNRYSMANAQESYAEHFRAFILETEAFHELAEKEEKEGHPELMQKYEFMKRMLEETQPTMLRLSKKTVCE